MAQWAKYLGMPAGRGVRGGELLLDVQPAADGQNTRSRLCTCLPVRLQGSLDAADHLRGKLGIDFKRDHVDVVFTLKEASAWCLRHGAVSS